MQRVVRSTLVGLLTLAGLTACGDKVTVPPPTSNPAGTVVHSVTVSPNVVSNLNIGDKITLAASVDADAGVTDRTVTWSSSNTAVATVDGSGTVTAVAGGNATIIAKSKADPNVSGAAAVSVLQTVVATVTVGQINQTVCVVGGACTSIPANLSNVANQLDVTLNVDAGTQKIAGVDLIMNCGGADTVVATQNLASAAVAPVAAEESNAPVTLSFNTAAFNATNGQVAFKNGACTIKGRVRTTAGTQTASSGTALTLNNLDVIIATTTTAPSTGQNATAAGANGLIWRAGAVSVSAVPVMYSGATVASGAITLVNASSHNAFGRNANVVLPGGTVSTLSNITPSAGVISASFPNTTSSTNQGVSGATVDSLFTVVTTVSSTGNNGPSITVPAGNILGNAFIRLDNLAPDISTPPTVNYNVQNNQNNWLGSAFTFTTNLTSSTPVITMTAATTADNGGVDVVKVNTFARPAGTGTYAQFTKTSDLAETSSASAYDLRLQVCDALNNCASTGTSTTTIYANFGIDLTPPTLTQLAGGVRDQGIYSIATPIPATVDFSVFDPVGAGGVSGSGTSTNGLLVKDQGLQPTATIPGSKTVCPIGNPQGSGNSVTCASGILQPNSITLPAAAKLDGEYTMTVQAADQAGNTSAAQTIKYYTDITQPTIPSQGVTIPNPITVNTAFAGFSATDNMDVKAGYGSLVYALASFAEGGTASPTGVAFDNVLTQQSTVGTTLATFYKSLTNAVGTIGALPTSVAINVVDVAGNLSGAPLSTPLPPANIGAAPTAAFNAGTNAVTAFAIDSTSAPPSPNLGVGVNKAITFYANVTPQSDLTGNPFSQVCFYYQVTSNNQFGSGAAANDWVKIGCTGGSGTVGVGATRRFFYSFTTTFPAAFNPANPGTTTFPVIAVANTSTLDALMSAPVTITITNPAP